MECHDRSFLTRAKKFLLLTFTIVDSRDVAQSPFDEFEALLPLRRFLKLVYFPSLVHSRWWWKFDLAQDLLIVGFHFFVAFSFTIHCSSFPPFHFNHHRIKHKNHLFGVEDIQHYFQGAALSRTFLLWPAPECGDEKPKTKKSWKERQKRNHLTRHRRRNLFSPT